MSGGRVNELDLWFDLLPTIILGGKFRSAQLCSEAETNSV